MDAYRSARIPHDAETISSAADMNVFMSLEAVALVVPAYDFPVVSLTLG